MVVLDDATASSAAGVCKEWSLPLDAASDLHEFSGADLVYAHVDARPRCVDRNMDCVHLCGKLRKRPAYASLRRGGVSRVCCSRLRATIHRLRAFASDQIRGTSKGDEGETREEETRDRHSDARCSFVRSELGA